MGTMVKNLILHDYQEKSFYHALRTKGFVILAGLSGTGKTKIFEEFSAGFDKDFIPIIKYTIASLNKLKAHLENVIEHSSLDDWKHFSSLLDTKGYRDHNKDLDDKLKKLLDDIGIEKSDLCLHYLTQVSKYKVRQKIGEMDNEVNDDEALTKLKNSIIPVLKAIKEQNTIDTNKLNEAFSTKVKDFIWFLYHPLDYENYNTIINHVTEYLKNYEKPKKLFLPVRPDFKDSKSLLGFYNPLKKEYQKSELLDFILKAQREYIEYGDLALPYLVLFDEMNLARVEYYFADFLSVLESKRVEDISDVDKEMLENIKIVVNNYEDEDLKDRLIGSYSKPIILHNENLSDIPQKLYLPPNIYFIGSVNIDETTYMFSPKVLDRAFTIEFDADIELYLNKLHENNNQNTGNVKSINVNKKSYDLRDFTREGQFAKIDKECVKEIGDKTLKFKINGNKISKRISDILKDIFSILQPYGLHFGYRVYDEIMMFVYNANEFTRDEYKMNLNEALDLAIKMKILPKFHGTRQKLEKPITKFIEYCMYLDQKNSDQNKEKKYLKPQSIPILKDGEIFLDDNKYSFKFPHTAKKLIEMLYKLQTQGFASFM